MSRHLCYLLLIISALFYSKANAKEASKTHNLFITVIDKHNNDPIVSAAIKYGSKPKNLDKYVMTDVNGQAKISIGNKNFYYEIEYLGYKRSNGILDHKKTHITIKLAPATESLNGVVVIGLPSDKPIKLSPVVTQVLSGTNLVNQGYGNLQDALMQETPGMNIQKVGFGNEMSMQGLDARHILFLMDGERMTGEMAGNLDYERFNLHAIERVEIVKGASSTLYGSRASGAVINLITKKTIRPFTISAGIRWAQMNEINFKHPSRQDFLYMFEKNADRPNLQAWVSTGSHKGIFTSQTDVWYSSSDAFYMYQDKKDKKVYTKKDNPNLHLSKDTTIISKMKRPPLGISGSEHISVAQKLYIEPWEWLSIQLYGNSFFMNTYDLVQDLIFTQSKDYTYGTKIKIGDARYLQAEITLHSDLYHRYKRHERVDVRKEVYNSQIWSPRLLLKSNYFKNHKLIGGIDYIRDDLTSDRFSVSDKMLTRGLRELEYYIQDDYTLNDKWSMELGLRTNYSKPFGLMGLPKFAVKYKPTKTISLRANYAMGFRSPSIKELFFNWDHLGMFMIVGDDNLQPEKNNYFSFNMEYDNDILFLSSNLYANFFSKKIEGVWRIHDFQYNFEYTNLQNQRLLGLDILARWRISSAFNANFSYSYVNVKDSHVVRINTTSPHAATVGLSYSYIKSDNYRLRASLQGSFTGSKSFDVQDRLTIKEATPSGEVKDRSRDAFFRCKLPAHFLCDFNVTQVFWQHYYLSLGVKNIFNYVPKTLGSGVTMFNIPATAGARAFVQLEYRY